MTTVQIGRGGDCIGTEENIFKLFRELTNIISPDFKKAE